LNKKEVSIKKQTIAKKNQIPMISETTNSTENYKDTQKMVIEKEPMVKLVLKDCKELLVEKKYIMECALISDILEDADSEEDEIPMIPLSNIEYETMEKIHLFLKGSIERSEIRKPVPLNQTLKDLVNPYEFSFLDQYNEVNVDDLTRILNACNFLNLKYLLDLCCIRISLMIRGKSSQEIRDLFGLEDDFTEEEREKIRSENKIYEEL